MIRIDFSQLHQAAKMPRRPCRASPARRFSWASGTTGRPGTADGYQQGSFATSRLEDVPSEYNVVAVAFMEGAHPDLPAIQPVRRGVSPPGRRAQRPGPRGADFAGAPTRTSSCTPGREQALAAEIVRLVETYGFDGLDIDLEQSAIDLADNSAVLPAALAGARAPHRAGQALHRQHGPGVPICTRTASTCLICRPWKVSYDFIAPQYYNQGGDGLWVQEANGGMAPGSRRTTTR